MTRIRKKCAVCGDTTPKNVIFKWRRDRDGKTVHVCASCAEECGKVNESSIDNFTDRYTLA